jgi:hypothetical protein
MAGYRTPGAIGIGANHPVIDEGTSARIQMFATGSLGIATPAPIALDNPIEQPVDAPVAQITKPPVAQVTAKGRSRDMTAGEIVMSKSIFNESVTYSQVKVHNRGWWPLGLQPDNVVMAPNGEMYFKPALFKEDFSVLESDQRRLFIHEMVHVWQYQLGYPVKRKGWQYWNLTYKYLLDLDARLRDYDMEQQGEVIADYFSLAVMKIPRAVVNPFYKDLQHIPLFEAVLADFLKAPSDKNNLPKPRD